MKLERSQVFDRPPEVVFDFVATDHVRNHSRWDPTIRLEQLSDGPIGVGTVFKRYTHRAAGPVEGTMEVVAFEPGRSWSVIIHDGPVEMHSRFIIEPEGDGRSRMTIHLDIPAMQDQLDPSMLDRSLENMKTLVEAEP